MILKRYYVPKCHFLGGRITIVIFVIIPNSSNRAFRGKYNLISMSFPMLFKRDLWICNFMFIGLGVTLVNGNSEYLPQWSKEINIDQRAWHMASTLAF
jgi:hypothetical protein